MNQRVVRQRNAVDALGLLDHFADLPTRNEWGCGFKFRRPDHAEIAGRQTHQGVDFVAKTRLSLHCRLVCRIALGFK
jgi:hypothetical protein